MFIMKKAIFIFFLLLGITVASNDISAWSEQRNSGYAREILWTYGCTNNPNRKCSPKTGTNYSTVTTNATNRWIRSSVQRHKQIIKSPKYGLSKKINGNIYNQKYAYASASVAVGKTNQRFHDFMKR